MPFTFSHPIYVLPLKYVSPKKLCLTGLILGSMSSDFGYFVMLEPYGGIGHTISGLFVHAIPMGIMLAFAFHRIIKQQLSIHLPSLINLDRRIYNSWGEWRLKNVKDWVFFIVSIILGFISHVFLNAFTHVNGYFVLKFSYLREFMLFDYPLYKLLQYSLSLIGKW